MDAHWVSLQYKDTDTLGLPIHEYKFATLSKDYDDTAALVANCDIVISVQTAAPHLAAAMGVEAWMFVCPLSEWKVAGRGPDTVWYKSMRLWRDTGQGWPIAEAIKELKGRKWR